MFHSSWVVVMMMVMTIMMMRNGWTSVSDQGSSWRVMTRRLTHSLGLPQLYPTNPSLSLQLITNVPPKTDHQLTIILRAFITPTLIEGMTSMVCSMIAMVNIAMIFIARMFSAMNDSNCHDIYCHDSYCHDIYCPPSADLPLRPWLYLTINPITLAPPPPHMIHKHKTTKS